MVGERPPTVDLFGGWWFAGYGFDGSGGGDVPWARARPSLQPMSKLLRRAAAHPVPCPATKVGFQPGTINDLCDQVHFWSLAPRRR